MARRRGNNFAASFLQGWNAGTQIAGSIRDYQMKDELAGVSEKQSETAVASGDEADAAAQAAFEQAKSAAATPEEVAKVEAEWKPTLDATQKAKGTAASTVYSAGSGAGFKQQNTQFDAGELADAAVVARSGIMRKYGKNDEADRMEATAQAKKLTGFQIAGQQREQTINKQFGEWSAQNPGATVQEKQTKLAEIQGANGAGPQAVEGGMRAMQIGEMQRGENKAKSKQAHEQAIAEYVKANPFQIGQDGKPVIDDQALVRLGMFQARDLAGRGMLQEARAAAGETMQYQKNLVTMQTEERKQAATLAASAALAGDMKPAIEVYNKFVPDGYQITGARQGKNGEIILDRVDESGQPADPKTIKDVKAMVAGLSGMADPSAVMNYLNHEAALDLQKAHLKVQEGQAGEQVRHHKASEVIARDSAEKTAKGHSPAQLQVMDRLVSTGIAKSEKEAWEMVNTSKEQSHDAAVQSVAAKLMGNVMYANDPAKAKADAERLVDSIRAKGASSPGGAKPATKAEYDNLPAGATYVGPDGKTYRKGK